MASALSPKLRRRQDASAPTTLSTETQPTPTVPTASDNAPQLTPAPAGTSITDPEASTTIISSPPTDQSTDNTSGSLINYYFIFFALLICLVAVGLFYGWRKRRKAFQRYHSNRQQALARDVNAWDPAHSRRRYWQGRWRSGEISREEGLNEEGEAPPPYMPKQDERDGGAGERDVSGQAEGTRSGEVAGAQEPAIPLQTLSREQAGLKPPDYETHVRAVDEERRNSRNSDAGSSRQPEQRS